MSIPSRLRSNLWVEHSFRDLFGRVSLSLHESLANVILRVLVRLCCVELVAELLSLRHSGHLHGAGEIFAVSPSGRHFVTKLVIHKSSRIERLEIDGGSHINSLLNSRVVILGLLLAHKSRLLLFVAVSRSQIKLLRRRALHVSDAWPVWPLLNFRFVHCFCKSSIKLWIDRPKITNHVDSTDIEHTSLTF